VEIVGNLHKFSCDSIHFKKIERQKIKNNQVCNRSPKNEKMI